MNEENTNTLFGKPWQNAFVFKTFKGADNKRNKLLEGGDVHAKVKRRSDGVFVVKTRPVSVEPTSNKKKKKARKKSAVAKG